MTGMFRGTRTLTALFSVALGAALLAGCRNPSTPETPETPEDTSPVEFLLLPATLNLAVGDTTQIKAVASMKDKTSQVVTSAGTWESSNAGVVSVNGLGIASAVSAGTAEVSVTFEQRTATVEVTISSTGTNATSYSGVAATPDGLAGLLTLSFGSDERVTGTFHRSREVVFLSGRRDATDVINVIGNGLSFLGTVSGAVVRGTFANASGVSGGFAAVESTHVAVTPYCGSYSSSAGTADAGPFALAVALNGAVVAASVPTGTTGTPLTFAGQRSGNSVLLTTNLSTAATGSFETGKVTGSFQTAAGGAATFSATTSSCP